MLKNNNSNIKVTIPTKANIRKVSMFCTKSVNNRWIYTSKIYYKKGQTSVIKEVFANNMTELVKNTKAEMKLIKL